MSRPDDSPQRPDKTPWAFLAPHSLALVCIAADPTARMRDLAVRLELTERSVQSLVAELAAGGFLTVTRAGRRNRYTVHPDRPLPNPLAYPWTVADLLAFGLGGRPKPD